MQPLRDRARCRGGLKVLECGGVEVGVASVTEVMPRDSSSAPTADRSGNPLDGSRFRSQSSARKMRPVGVPSGRRSMPGCLASSSPSTRAPRPLTNHIAPLRCEIRTGRAAYSRSRESESSSPATVSSIRRRAPSRVRRPEQPPAPRPVPRHQSPPAARTEPTAARPPVRADAGGGRCNRARPRPAAIDDLFARTAVHVRRYRVNTLTGDPDPRGYPFHHHICQQHRHAPIMPIPHGRRPIHVHNRRFSITTLRTPPRCRHRFRRGCLHRARRGATTGCPAGVTQPSLSWTHAADGSPVSVAPTISAIERSSTATGSVSATPPR